MELKETRDGRKLTVICRGSGIEWEKIEAVEKQEIDEWMDIQVREDDIRYSCPDFDPLSLRFESPITSFDFYMIIAQIARSSAILEHLGLEEQDILWDVDHIYMSLNTRELKFMYIPVKRKRKNNTVKNLIDEIVYELSQSDYRDIYMAEFAYYLKQPDAYSAKSLIRYVTEKEFTISRLLRLNEEIEYKPIVMKRTKKVEKSTFDIFDFGSMKKEIPIEEEEKEEVTFKKSSKVDVGIGEFNFLKQGTPIISSIQSSRNGIPSMFAKTEESVEKEEEIELGSTDAFESFSDHSSIFATITRISNGEEKVIDEDEFYMGKSNKLNGFPIEGNATISRRHALILKKDNLFYIRDLDSVNHTYVNNRKVKIGCEVLLKDGDIIQLANEKFEFHIFMV